MVKYKSIYICYNEFMISKVFKIRGKKLITVISIANVIRLLTKLLAMALLYTVDKIKHSMLIFGINIIAKLIKIFSEIYKWTNFALEVLTL